MPIKPLSSDEISPLHGVPITIKENTDQAGRATNHEVLDFEDRFAEDDSPLVKNLLNAGAIPLRSHQFARVCLALSYRK